MTSKCRKLKFLFLFCSILLNIAPLAIYTIKAFLASDLVHEKVALSMTVFIVAIMSVICLINKTTMKSRLWIIIIGLYLCLDNFITPLIIIGVCQVVDEWIANPLYRHYKLKTTINKELDKRAKV